MVEGSCNPNGKLSTRASFSYIYDIVLIRWPSWEDQYGSKTEETGKIFKKMIVENK